MKTTITALRTLGGGGKPFRSLAFDPHLNFGFTLAEVLITLGIIGIVAAMTMPTLIQKNQEKELISRTKKVYADINNSLQLAQKDYGVIGDNGFLFNANDNSLTAAQNWAKYFSGSKVCASKSQSGCSQYYYDVKHQKLQADVNNSATVYNNDDLPKIILPNGAIIMVATNQSGCDNKSYTGTRTDALGRPLKNPDGTNQTYTYNSTICANISFDVNGAKNPNQYGRDNYWFWVYRNKLEPREQSLKNIMTGKDKLEYENYSKGQSVQ